MSPVVLTVAIAVLTFAVAELLVTLWMFSRGAHYDEIATTERIRLKFGQARSRLVEAAMNGVIDSHSFSFRHLYSLQTLMMRGTKDYSVISEKLWTGVLRPSKRISNNMRKEAKTWAPEIHAIANETADAIREVWFSYVPFEMGLRVVARALVMLGIASYESMRQVADSWLNLWFKMSEPVADCRERMFGDVVSVRRVQAAKHARAAEDVLRQYATCR